MFDYPILTTLFYISTNLILWFLIGVELFINLPMNGVYTLPYIHENKNKIITYGLLISLILAFIIIHYIHINSFIAMGLIFAYFIYQNIRFNAVSQFNGLM